MDRTRRRLLVIRLCSLAACLVFAGLGAQKVYADEAGLDALFSTASPLDERPPGMLEEADSATTSSSDARENSDRWGQNSDDKDSADDPDGDEVQDSSKNLFLNEDTSLDVYGGYLKGAEVYDPSNVFLPETVNPFARGQTSSDSSGSPSTQVY